MAKSEHIRWDCYKDKDKDSFIGLQEFVVGYSKAPEQLQSSARPICHSHPTTSTGNEPATIRIAAYGSSPHYALRNGRRRKCYLWSSFLDIAWKCCMSV